jgi:hypothetical protein
MSRRPHFDAIASNKASACAVSRTSSGSRSEASTAEAHGSTWGRAFSLRYVIAISAPARCIACAQPHAIERSLATPTISAFWPSRIKVRASSGGMTFALVIV